MTSNRRPQAQRIGNLGFEMMTRLAMDTETPATREERLRQMHEINPGRFHGVVNIAPDRCPYCVDEVA